MVCVCVCSAANDGMCVCVDDSRLHDPFCPPQYCVVCAAECSCHSVCIRRSALCTLLLCICIYNQIYVVCLCVCLCAYECWCQSVSTFEPSALSCRGLRSSPLHSPDLLLLPLSLGATPFSPINISSNYLEHKLKLGEK